MAKLTIEDLKKIKEKAKKETSLRDGEATVKRLRLRTDGIQLVPSHPAMEPFLIRDDEQLRIIGKVVAVFRFLEPEFSVSTVPRLHWES